MIKTLLIVALTLNLLNTSVKTFSIPVIAFSGAGKAEHLSEVFERTGVEAAPAPGIFHRMLAGYPFEAIVDVTCQDYTKNANHTVYRCGSPKVITLWDFCRLEAGYDILMLEYRK